ncbi:MAG: LysM peptidoglycan-binding domain-containing protein [Thermodesulfobacteriota bacterium]
MKKNLLAALSLGAFFFLASGAVADELAVPANGDATGKAAEEEVFIYTIVPHDTLWDISQKFLNNPFKWPKLWRINPYIKNPDLIYPGNLVRITPNGIEIISRKEVDVSGLPVVKLEPEKENIVVLEPPPEPVVVPPPPPPPMFASDRIPRAGFITDRDLGAAGTLIGPRETKLMMTSGDDVYVSFAPDVTARKGDTFSIFKVGEAIKHPDTGEKLGNMIDVLGRLTITGAEGEVLVARIGESFKEIGEGVLLKPFAEPVTEVEITNPESDVEGYVVASLEHTEQISEANIVYIDRGTDDGLLTGNVMRVYRPAGTVKDPMNKGKTLELPPLELGTLIVTEADDKTSSALVIDSLRPIVWGDRVNTVRAERITGKK